MPADASDRTKDSREWAGIPRLFWAFGLANIVTGTMDCSFGGSRNYLR